MWSVEIEGWRVELVWSGVRRVEFEVLSVERLCVYWFNSHLRTFSMPT